jgi:uncharacterized protein (DUF58 family)
MHLVETLQRWLLKRVSKQDSVTLSAGNIYILPTREGLIFAFLILIMLSAAINFNNSLIFFITFLLTGVGIISMLMTQRNLLDLNFSISHVQSVFCYEVLHIPLNISQYKISKHAKLSIATTLDGHCEITDIHPHDTTLVRLTFASHKRGHANLPPFEISSIFPLGLFRAWANIDLNSDAIVYPKPAKNFSYHPETGTDSEGQGEKGRGFDDFSGFKTYQAGESLRQIHWKAYAREQGLLSKIFSGSNTRDYWIRWNELSSHDTEQKLSQICRLLINAEQRGDRYGLELPSQTFTIDQGYQHQHRCLKAIALMNSSNE